MDSKNVIAAIALSSAVIVLYSLFFIPEQTSQNQNLIEKEKIEQNTDTPSLEQKENLVTISRDEALKEIAKQAIQRKTGARGLRSIMEDLLMDTMFGLPNNELEKVIIDEKTAVSKTDPIKLFKTKSKKTSSGN